MTTTTFDAADIRAWSIVTGNEVAMTGGEVEDQEIAWMDDAGRIEVYDGTADNGSTIIRPATPDEAYAICRRLEALGFGTDLPA